MNRKPNTPPEQPKPDEQPQGDGQRKPDETPPPKPKWTPDPSCCVDLTETEPGWSIGIVGARDPRRRKKSD